MIQLLLNNDLSLQKPEKAKEAVSSYVSKHFDANITMQMVDLTSAVIHLTDDSKKSHVLLLTKGIIHMHESQQ